MTRWLTKECLRTVESQANMCHPLILRRLRANILFSGECLRPVGSQLSLCVQLVLRRVCENNSISGE